MDDEKKNAQITARDVEHLWWNRVFGDVGLPIPYIHALTKHLRKGAKDGYPTLQKRVPILTRILGLIEAPAWQRRTDKPWSNFRIYRNTPEGNKLLKAHSRYLEGVPAASGSPFHDTYTACALASIYLGVKKVGGFIELQHEILARLGMHTKKLKLELDGLHGEPDAIFKINVNNKPILVFVETDRATEPVRTRDDTRRSWRPRIIFYRKLIGEARYKDIFKEDCGALLMVLTVSASNRDNILSVVGEEFSNGCNYMLAYSNEAFGFQFHPPRPFDLLTIEWPRSGKPPFRFIPAVPTEPLQNAS